MAYLNFVHNPVLTSYDLHSAERTGIEFPIIYLCPSLQIHASTWKEAWVLPKWEETWKNALKYQGNVSALNG